MEDQFQSYQKDPNSVSHEWRTFFQSMESGYDMVSKAKGGAPVQANVGEVAGGASTAQSNVTHLISAYRTYGHQAANINPLAPPKPKPENLTLSGAGLSESQLNETFVTDGCLPKEKATLKEILNALETTYTGSIGVQYTTLPNVEERLWLRQKMEPIQNKPTYSTEEKATILEGLLKADKFENFLHTKYVGLKRFSIEGGDAMIPMLDTMVEMAGEHGVEDIVLGMAHRGRLNTLVNIMKKPVEEVFAAFNDTLVLDGEFATGSGDVKYHMGKSYDVTTRKGHQIHMSLLNNPSHLEMVNPVVAGSARAKQLMKGKDGFKKVVPLVIHGDSAFAGQGVVPETLNLADLEGYTNGGTVHIVINNQVGFTANPEDTFSGEYCTDIARLLRVPVFHVNGEDPEACNHVMQLAMEWRAKFGRDVVIDLVCYRRYGHNEGDDPTFTQPVMYKEIKKHPTPFEKYKKELVAEGSLSDAEATEMEEDYLNYLAEAFANARENQTKINPDMFGGAWQNFTVEKRPDPKTGVSKKVLGEIATCYTNYPSDFHVNSKVDKGMERRASMVNGEIDLDWGAAEVTAYATLLNEGYSVRISGQDVRRGTFSHRHIGLYDSEDGHVHYPVAQMADKGASLQVYNSSLSELAVLGYEFGYSLASPNTLTIWEAQFGDFANGAQIMIDQFITSSEVKWYRMSGLAMLLPHGYEGQGPEHSSARPERFLQMCAEDNMTVCNVSTPAQIFHLLRRHMKRSVRRPLVVFSPKSLLRHPRAVSPVSELAEGSFHTVIGDEGVKADAVKRVVLCTGKVYYDLVAAREEAKQKDVAIIRVEELYPLPLEAIQKQLAVYKNATSVVWAQEEPRNQGYWRYMQDNLGEHIKGGLTFVGRPASASPAVGSVKRHKQEQAEVVKAALQTNTSSKKKGK